MNKKKLQTTIIVAILIVVSYIGLDYTNILKPQQSDAAISISENTLQYYFPRNDQDPKPVLIGIINNSKEQLDIAIYSITDQDIANAIVDAKQRGVNVRILTDATQSAGKSQTAALDILRDAGITIKINKHSGLMHLKVTIADKQIVTTGSFNYSKAAENQNDEVFVVVNNTQVASDFTNEFERMWNDTSGFIEF